MSLFKKIFGNRSHNKERRDPLGVGELKRRIQFNKQQEKNLSTPFSSEQYLKQCAVCLEQVPKDKLVCPSCGRSSFLSSKRHSNLAPDDLLKTVNEDSSMTTRGHELTDGTKSEKARLSQVTVRQTLITEVEVTEIEVDQLSSDDRK